MKTGFTFVLGRKDIFIETSYKNKTIALAKQILTTLMLPVNPDTEREMLYYLNRATCEIKTLANGRQYYEISGDNFGGRGSFIDDGNTIIIKM